MKILLLNSLVVAQCFAFDVSKFSFSCTGFYQTNTMKDQLDFNLVSYLERTRGEERLAYVRKVFRFDYSRSLPIFEYQDVFDLYFWNREYSNSVLKLYDFKVGEKENILVQINTESLSGSYASYSMEYSIPLTCKTLEF